jgi:hypothetical protein
MWVALMALLTFASPSWASDDFPTSENPATGKWRVMKPSSFTLEMSSVLAQCNRAAQVSDTDRLTTAMCQTLPALIQGGKCEKRQVPDGVVFDHMNGHESGMSRVTKHVEKALGRTDPALICNLGNRTFAYWFTGEKRSCNNIGIVFTAPPVVAPTPPPPAPPVVLPPPPPKVVEAPPVQQLRCSTLPRRYIVPSGGETVYIPGLAVEVCRGHVPIPDIFVSIPSSVTVVTRDEPVCQPTN